MSGKRWGMIAFLSIVAIMAIGTFIAFQQLNKPDKTVETFEEAVEQNKPNLLKGIILPDNKEAVVNTGTLASLVTYLRTNDQSYQVIKDGLKGQMEAKEYSPTNEQISLTADGKKWGIFTNYKLKVKTASIKVIGDNENDRVQLSIKTLKNQFKTSDDKIYGPILPGIHDVNVTVTNSLGTLAENKKVDVWGNEQVTFVVDTERLAKNDKGISDDIVAAVELLNKDLSVFETSAYNIDVFTNVNDTFTGGEYTQAAIDEEFSNYVDYIDEIQSQYLGSVVNLDQLSIDYFNGHWSADVTALVSYNRKIKFTDLPTYEDLSYKSIRNYALGYNDKEKRWLIEGITDTEADGTEHESWKKKKTLTVKNPPLQKWSSTNSGDPITSL
ncbi:hypothetical protein HHO41_20125 [Bacillus sp. DNRA2]|uniref:TcaA second domain-containing protein n=1 Tax=Bacillus sp. DNRA2 TaxID=2723053 RepID=UPI00145D2D27|nr:hypothetical protein [Bacillus sp. DNRA2]NMD72562.1 hypothetical protein [Bacillus sp. DNRA2]